ncbi:MAG: hypothetical protein LBL51_06555 [Synergistaceae bacterium]|jgi:hypothetical protein|nr:hypothetical protein [Synergistaceae bacterium]
MVSGLLPGLDSGGTPHNNEPTPQALFFFEGLSSGMGFRTLFSEFTRGDFDIKGVTVWIFL